MAKDLTLNRDVSLCEVLDRVLNTGVVVVGEVVISVAGVDLIYLGLQLVLTSVETANRVGLVLNPHAQTPHAQTPPSQLEPKLERAWT